MNWTRSLMVSLVAGMSIPASAAWMKFAENERLTAYYEPMPGTATVWVLFDYKTEQESTRSGRRYHSEKGQHEVDCSGQRSRTVFFTWHAGRMGDGVVVYTGRAATPWEPNSPGGIGRALAAVVCSQR